MSVMSPDADRRPARKLEPAVVLLALAFVMLLVFQLVQMIRESGNIHRIHAAQEQNLVEGKRLLAQLNSIAGKTAALADAGDTNAKAIIDEMRKLGIQVKPSP
jgi:hypothetical protein